MGGPVRASFETGLMAPTYSSIRAGDEVSCSVYVQRKIRCFPCVGKCRQKPYTFLGRYNSMLQPWVVPDQSNTQLVFRALRNRKELEEERRRRVKAETIISRTKPGGLRTDGFPNVRDVVRHVEQLTDVVLRWTSKATAVVGSHQVLPSTMRHILVQTFVVCREEVTRCLDKRLQSLSAFLGNDEPVTLAGDESMNLDTQYVLYETLCTNHQTIVSVEQEVLNELSNVIVQRCGGLANSQLTNMIFGDARSYFEALLKSYIMVFVEVRRSLWLFITTWIPSVW